MPIFWRAVNNVIKDANILLEVIDARSVEETRNPEIEDKVRRSGKVLIYVLNKCDLADQKEMEKIKKTMNPCVFVSCKDYSGIKILKEKILIAGKRINIERPRVGVLGYPNMGKSSIINALNGAGKAKVSSVSGVTRGAQHINARGFVLIDTPGVIPYLEKDIVKHSITGIITDSKDPEGDVLKIMESKIGLLENHYGVPIIDDKEETLEAISKKLNLLIKGGKADIFKTSQRILKALRDGIIKY
jgi:ribosome biogenesis GTPase A